MHIEGFKYYTSWTKKSFSMHSDHKQYVYCTPLIYGKDWKEEYAIIKKKALENKEYISKEYEELILRKRYDSEVQDLLRKITNFKQRNSNDPLL